MPSPKNTLKAPHRCYLCYSLAHCCMSVLQVSVVLESRVMLSVRSGNVESEQFLEIVS